MSAVQELLRQAEHFAAGCLARHVLLPPGGGGCRLGRVGSDALLLPQVPDLSFQAAMRRPCPQGQREQQAGQDGGHPVPVHVQGRLLLGASPHPGGTGRRGAQGNQGFVASVEDPESVIMRGGEVEEAVEHRRVVLWPPRFGVGEEDSKPEKEEAGQHQEDGLEQDSEAAVEKELK